MRKNFIYVLLNTSGIPIYVGKSFNVEQRFKDHARVRPNAASFVVVEEVVDGDCWMQRERTWYVIITSLGYVLENKNPCGSGCSSHTEEARVKIKTARAKQIIPKASAETKLLLSLSHLGKSRSQESIQKQKKAITGRTKSQEHKDKIAASLLGHSVSQETRDKISATKRSQSKSAGA